MLAVVPGAQRVLARQVRRKTFAGSYHPGAGAIAGASTAGGTRARVSPHLDGQQCPTTGSVRRLSLRARPPRSEQQQHQSASGVGLGVGALLTAGGLLLALQGLPTSGNPAAMEAEGGRGDARCRRAAAADDSDQTHPDGAAEDEDNNHNGDKSPPAAPDSSSGDGPPPHGDAGGDGGGGGGGDDGEWEGDFPPEGRYKYYILSQEEAAAEATTAAAGAGGGAADGGDGAGGGLKGRYHFVIIGEGTAADAAMESILRMQPEAEILCLSDETPSPADDSSNTHTGNYESDFRLLKSDLAASFNQWRRHLTFRMERFTGGRGPGSGSGSNSSGEGARGVGAERGRGRQGRGRGRGGRPEEWEGRSAYGLSRGKEIRYHTYQPHSLVIEPERRCVRLLLDGTEVYFDKCLIANSGRAWGDIVSATGGGSLLLFGDGGSSSRKSGGTSSSSVSGGGRSTLDGGDAPRQQRREHAAAGAARGGEQTHPGGGGSEPVSCRSSCGNHRVNRLMTLQDFVSLELLADNPSVRRVTVLGGGFVGCEVALALAERGRATGMAVTQVYSESAPMEHVLPGYLSEYMRERLAAAGVTAVAGTSLAGLRYNSRTKRLEREGADGGQGQAAVDESPETDYIVVASTLIGPKVDAARDSGLEIDQINGGIVVNGLFEAVNGVYAAGGAASFFDPAIGRRRISSHDHCVNSGLYAGYNMAATLKAAENEHGLAEEEPSSPASSSTPAASALASSRPQQKKGPPSAPHPRLYDHLPFWRSNLAACNVVMEGLGELDPSLRTMGVWLNNPEDWHSRDAMYTRGVVYYMRDDKVTGILLLNVSDQLERAREVLRLHPRVTNVAHLKRLIALGGGGLIRVVDTPASSMHAEP